MIKFDKPINLNGKELVDELNAAGVTIKDRPLDDGFNLWLDIASKDQSKAKGIVDLHNGTIVATDEAAILLG